MQSMKTWLSRILIGALCCISVGALAYGIYTASRLHRLEQQLQEARVAWQSRAEPRDLSGIDARLQTLERRLQSLEAVPKTPGDVPHPAVAIPGFQLEQRVQKLEQALIPHLEYLGR